MNLCCRARARRVKCAVATSTVRYMMRIALGEIVQETGSFTPSRMGRAAFEAYGLYQGAELLAQLPGVGPPGGFL